MNTRRTLHLVLPTLMAVLLASCGGSAPPPQSAEDEEDIDPVAAVVGDVQPEAEDIKEATPDDVYTGPTTVTVNLRVVDQRNPKGSYKLSDLEGKAIIENGKLGEPVDVNQGSYTLEFSTPLVFGGPTYVVEDVTIAGKEMQVNQTFPAGQTTLHTYRGKAENRCIPVPFTVHSKTLEKDLTGKGKTCDPVILETGHYEILLDLGKNKVQPVEMRVNAEQMANAPVKLED